MDDCDCGTASGASWKYVNLPISTDRLLIFQLVFQNVAYSSSCIAYVSDSDASVRAS